MPDVHSLHALQFVHSRHFIFLFPLAFSAWRDTTNKSVYQISKLNLEPRYFGLTHTTSIELKEDLEEEAASEEDSAANSSSEEEAAEEEDAEEMKVKKRNKVKRHLVSFEPSSALKITNRLCPIPGYTAVYHTAKSFIP